MLPLSYRHRCPPSLTRRAFVTGLAAAAALAACAPDAAERRPAVPAEPPVTQVHVFKGGWHTGFVLARRDVPESLVPEIADFPQATHLELSWGDRDYYPARDPGLAAALAAGLTPSPTVMHVVGYARPPAEVHHWADSVAVPLGRGELERLVAAIAASFDRPPGGRAERLQPGLYGQSWFYPAEGEFHLFNTCNNWVARILEGAGLQVDAGGIIRAETLMEQVRALPRVARPGG